MNRYIAIGVIFLLLLSGIVSLGGCSTRGDKPDITLGFDTLCLEKKQHLLNDTTQPCCHLSMQLHYPTSGIDSIALEQLSALYITGVLGEAYSMMPIESAVQVYINDYLTEYKELESEIQSYNMVGAYMNYELTITDSLLYNKGGIYSFGANCYTFMGGAHGLYATHSYNIDIATQQIITIGDLLQEGTHEYVGDLIRTSLTAMAEEDIVYYEMQEVCVTDNFFIGDSGLTWTFNPYDIASYAMGSSYVLVTYADLLPYLQPQSPIEALVKTATTTPK